jgi:hypothetical protein
LIAEKKERSVKGAVSRGRRKDEKHLKGSKLMIRREGRSEGRRGDEFFVVLSSVP